MYLVLGGFQALAGGGLFLAELQDLGVLLSDLVFQLALAGFQFGHPAGAFLQTGVFIASFVQVVPPDACFSLLSVLLGKEGLKLALLGVESFLQGGKFQLTFSLAALVGGFLPSTQEQAEDQTAKEYAGDEAGNKVEEVFHDGSLGIGLGFGLVRV